MTDAKASGWTSKRGAVVAGVVPATIGASVLYASVFHEWDAWFALQAAIAGGLLGHLVWVCLDVRHRVTRPGRFWSASTWPRGRSSCCSARHASGRSRPRGATPQSYVVAGMAVALSCGWWLAVGNAWSAFRRRRRERRAAVPATTV